MTATDTAPRLRPARTGFVLRGRFMTAVSAVGLLAALALAESGQVTDALMYFGTLGAVFGVFWASAMWSELRTISPCPPDAVVGPESAPTVDLLTYALLTTAAVLLTAVNAVNAGLIGVVFTGGLTNLWVGRRIGHLERAGGAPLLERVGSSWGRRRFFAGPDPAQHRLP